jgi:hypothetical protein
MGTDVLTWYQVSAQGGHAGPGSTTPYINRLEEAMAAASRCARPSAWVARSEGLSESTIFPDIGNELLGVRPPFPHKMTVSAPPTESADVSINLRADILWRVINQVRFDAVASVCNIHMGLVFKVQEELIDVLIQLQMIKNEFRASPGKQCSAVSAYFRWARAARQPKYSEISKFLTSECAAGNWKSMRTLWQDWSLCRHGRFISLMNPRPATRLITALLEAGVSKKQMLVLSTKDAVPQSSQIKNLKILSRPCEPRGQRAGHRLFIVQHGVDAASANAATLSVAGLHWWMLVLGSVLISKGEI